jgi:hypothetical protein
MVRGEARRRVYRPCRWRGIGMRSGLERVTLHRDQPCSDGVDAESDVIHETCHSVYDLGGLEVFFFLGVHLQLARSRVPYVCLVNLVPNAAATVAEAKSE